ncbi:MAG: hypothetical protein Q9211_006657 [Gyalolechia sp. 1 TL-2023]
MLASKDDQKPFVLKFFEDCGRYQVIDPWCGDHGEDSLVHFFIDPGNVGFVAWAPQSTFIHTQTKNYRKGESGDYCNVELRDVEGLEDLLEHMKGQGISVQKVPKSAQKHLADCISPPLLLMSKGDARPSEPRPKRLVYSAGPVKPLQFLNVKKDPEVERKLARNRWAVRSNATKHAVLARKHVVEKTKARSNPSQMEVGALPTSHDNEETPVRYPQELALRASRRTAPRSLWPIGTVAARTNFSELNLISAHFHQVRSRYSIFSHVLTNPDSARDLASVVLQSSVIYHATLYVVTIQLRSCAMPLSSGVRNPIVHEAIVLRSVQDAISSSVLPRDEIIFAIVLLGISQGVAKMMHTLDIADEVEYGHMLPAQYNLRPQLPSHSENESLRLSEGISFIFLAQRQIIHMELAQNLQMIATPIESYGVSHSRSYAHAAMLALSNWISNSFQVSYSYEPNLQLDEPARIGGLLYYCLAYEGGRHSAHTTFSASQLRSELMKLRSEHEAVGLLHHNRLCLILWILYCGGAFATDKLRAWYTNNIRIVSGDTGKDWYRTKEILKYFAWNDDACEGPMGELWRESLINMTNEVTESESGTAIAQNGHSTVVLGAISHIRIPVRAVLF